jgi:hypothetical protein
MRMCCVWGSGGGRRGKDWGGRVWSTTPAIHPSLPLARHRIFNVPLSLLEACVVVTALHIRACTERRACVMEGGREEGMAAGGRRVHALGLFRVILPFMPGSLRVGLPRSFFPVLPPRVICLWMPFSPFPLSFRLVTALNHPHHATNRKEKLA